MHENTGLNYENTISILILLLASILHAQSSFIVGTDAVPVIF